MNSRLLIAFLLGIFALFIGCGGSSSGGGGNNTAINDCSIIPDGPGQPSITATVPARGSSAQVSGQVKHLLPQDYRVAFYIRVGGGWWTKPTFARPTVDINCDGRGSFSSAYATGGNDINADAFIFYVIRQGYSPPTAAGSSSLPGIESVADTGIITR